ncbi:hypothetical protein DOTSEDRAFT_75142 [Dothistroma septosporum NZE10]|uniref:Uncharacterized protein n=1 Tax=Dothistroma septosporum (strain NZE10 / CBS 128990) TaxID=675120 RepID=M2YKD9_DOTSN|nr:hypothetical protein DOTSEDRAFT_75142 [Dothistroma septosporum NZE10]
MEAKCDRIDVLINNAGAAFDSKLLSKELTVREVWNKDWDTNVTGAHVVTETFLPLLLKPSAPRLLFNTSDLSSLEDASDAKSPFYKEASAGLPKPFSPVAYQCSKTALNMLVVNWMRLKKQDGVKVFGVAPGFLATGLGGNPGLLKKAGAGDPGKGGAALVAVVEGKHDDHAGRVVREYGDGPVQKW